MVTRSEVSSLSHCSCFEFLKRSVATKWFSLSSLISFMVFLNSNQCAASPRLYYLWISKLWKFSLGSWVRRHKEQFRAWKGNQEKFSQNKSALSSYQQLLLSLFVFFVSYCSIYCTTRSFHESVALILEQIWMFSTYCVHNHRGVLFVMSPSARWPPMIRYSYDKPYDCRLRHCIRFFGQLFATWAQKTA